MRTITKATIVVGLSAGVVAALSGTALADPSSTPSAASIVAVGSDTTQNVFNQFSTDYNATSPAKNLYSFNATDGTSSPSNITPKTGCSTTTVRPNGSGAGISALKANARPTGDTTNYCIDIARSSRGPQSGDGTAISFVRFAQDAVTWSATSTSAKPTNAPASLSNTELKAIYSCDASLLGGGATGPVKWNQVGGTSTNAVVPVLPQSSSGTRSFFLSAIGSPTLGSCVQGTSTTPEENEGTDTIFSGTNSQDLVFPYSVAVYLAQSQNGHDTGRQGNQVLGSAENGSTVIPPTTGTAPNKTINSNLGQVGLTRFVYNVVRDNGTSTHVPTYLQPLLGDGSGSGYLCTNTTAQADIKSYGFNTISTCGTVTAGIA